MVNIFDRLNDGIRNSEASLVNLLSAIAPWLAPLAPAYLSYTHMSAKLAFPKPIAWAVAIVVEVMGLSAVSTALLFWAHNKRYSKEYKKAPIKIVIGAFVFYLAVILAINVLLEISVASWALVTAKSLLTLLSIPAALILAVRTQHQELLNEIKDRRKPTNVAPRKTVQELAHRPALQKVRIYSYMNKLWQEAHVVASFSQIVQELDVPKSTASAIRRTWLAEHKEAQDVPQKEETLTEAPRAE